MVRNLYIVKGFPFKPMRFCLKNTDPFDLNFMIRIIINNRGERVIRAKRAKKTSNTLFLSERE